MAVVFARIRVSDIEKWKMAFAEGELSRREAGVTFRAMYRDAGYWNGILLVLDCEDVERAQAYYASDEQRQRIARSGLETPAEMWMGKDLED